MHNSFENGYDTYTDKEYICGMAQWESSGEHPKWIFLKSDDVDSMDDSDMEEMG